MQFPISRSLLSRRPAAQRHVPRSFLSRPGVSALVTAAALISFAAFGVLGAETKEIANSASNSGQFKTWVKSETDIYFREVRENNDVPAPVRSYQAIPAANGFADDVSRTGVTFPVSYN